MLLVCDSLFFVSQYLIVSYFSSSGAMFAFSVPQCAIFADGILSCYFMTKSKRARERAIYRSS